MKRFIYLFIALLFNVSCTKSKNEINTLDINDLTEKKVYDDDDDLMEVYTLTQDFNFKNERSFWYKNKAIKKWYWYNGDTSNVPFFIINYDSLGNYIDCKGMPFINAHTTKDGFTAIEFVQPPTDKVFSEYRDYFEGELVDKVIYEPAKSDSTMWVTLLTHRYDSTHSYYVYFVLLNEDNTLFIRDSIQLVP